jgi:CDP-4-dehydro-6-deoxyglucose reductase
MQVILNNGKSFNLNQGENLLHAALQQGLVLEHSCKTGRCGVCKTKVIIGETTVLQNEESLSEQEQQDGLILTCCRTAITDVSLDIEDLGFLAGIETKTLPCRIDALDKLSGDVVQVTLRLPPNQPLRFLAGQYIDLIANGIRRSYSIANAPRDDNKLVLEVRQVEKGQMSDYLFHTAKVNDLLRIEGPLGTFCLRETTKTPLFIATGTGIAPIKAMIATLPNTQPISVYWGGRTEADIYWQSIPDHVNLVSVLSRADDVWQGARGYVQNAVLADYSDLSDFVVYACGSEAMIRDAKAAFIQSGLSEKTFYSDAFVSSS